MRARFARPRRIARGRLVVPVAAAAAVALVGGVVVAVPDSPLVRDDVKTVASAEDAFRAGADVSIAVNDVEWVGAPSGFVATGVAGLPAGLTFSAGFISGTPERGGLFPVTVSGEVNSGPYEFFSQLLVLNEDGSLPTGLPAGSEGVLGSLGIGEDGPVTTGSEGVDLVLGSVSGSLTALGSTSDSATDLVTGSTTGAGSTAGSQAEGGTDSSDSNGSTTESLTGGPLGSTTEILAGSTSGSDSESPSTSPLGSVTESLAGTPLGSVTESVTGSTPGQTTPGSDSLTSSTGEGSGTLNSESLGSSPAPENGTLTITANGQPGPVDVPGLTLPGSSDTTPLGSLGDLAPGLALTGAALLGLAGLSIVLNGGSSAPGTSPLLPFLPGSSTSPGTGPGTPSAARPGSGSIAPTVAAGTPNRVQAPGPTVANGRG